MKLVQINAWCGKLGHPLIDFLKTEKPDIVCIQEASDIQGHAGPLFVSLDEIKSGAGFQYAIMAPVLSYPFMKREYSFGNAVLSNLPHDDYEVVFTRGSYTKGFDITEDDLNIRNFQHLTFQIGNEAMHILNHHGHYIPKSKAGNDETMRQMGILAKYIEGLHGKIILCGDFNLSPESSSIGIINDRLVNLPVKFGIKNTYSEVHHNHIVCDYIFVNEQVEVKQFRVADQIVSDHKALIVEF